MPIGRSIKRIKMLALLAGSLLFVAVPGQAVTFENGEYEVVVAIDPAMAEDLTMIEKIKTMMKDASKYLHTSLKGQAIFGKVVILVPDSWTNVNDVKPSEGETVAGADIFVGKNVACGACASAGRIQIDDGEMSGATIVHEWGHFQFGLGDEYCDYVYKNNGWYQVYKTTAGWNRCTALQEIERSCDERLQSGAGCSTTKNEVNGAKASIMHRQWNSGIDSWCDDSDDDKYKHNKDVNTHQNRIHSKKSSWAVIGSLSEGFKYSPAAGDKITYKDPEFELKQSGKPNIMLVMDISGSMAGSRIKNAAQAAKNFVDRAEKGSYIGVVSFGSSASLLLGLTKVDFPDTENPTATDTRPTIKAAIPTTTSGMTSIGAGMQSALTELTASTNELAKVMALLTDGGENTSPMISDVLPSVVAAKVKVFSIGLSAAADRKMQDIASDTGGEYFYTSGSDPQALYDIFTSIGNKVSSQEENTVVSIRQTIAAGESKTFQANIDASIGKNTIFSFSFTNGNAVDMDVFLTQPNGVVLDSAYTGYRQDDVSQIIAFDIAGMAQSGTWTATVANNGSRDADATMETTSVTSPGQRPVTLTAKLDKTRVQYPELIKIEASLFSDDAILYANVWAEITDPQGEKQTMTLQDHGQGADRFPLDGTYSGYFSNYTSNGYYSVKVFADNAGNTAEVGAGFKDGPGVQSDRDILVASQGDWLYSDETLLAANLMSDPSASLGYNFDRVISAGAFELTSYSTADTIPPSRITTLSVVKVEGKSVVLNWFATGDDADTGQVTEYDLRYSDSDIEDDEDFNEATRIDILESPKEAGEPETYTVDGLEPGTYYFAVKAIDDADNASPLSNVYKAVTTSGGSSSSGGCFINQIIPR